MLAPLRGTPLRVKLVAAVLALVTAALLVIGAASTFFLRNYLLDQVDGNLRSLNNNVQALLRDNIQFAVGDNAFAVASTPAQPTLNDLSSKPSQLFTPDGPDLPQNYQGLQQSLRQHHNDPFTVKAIGSQTRWRVLMVQPQDSSAIVAVGFNLSDVDHTVKQLLWIDGLAGGTVLIVLATVGAAIVRSNLKPLRQIERTTVAIAAGDLSQRVPDTEPGVEEPKTELGRLSRALNSMLTQIETAFAARADSEAAARDAAFAAQASEARALRSEERMRQFVADASHELRTPLTTIRGFAELYRQGAAAGSLEDTARLVRRIEDEAARMGLLVEDLLLLARLDRERPLSLSPVELRVLASEAVQAAQAMAPDRDISIEIAPRAGLLVVQADDARLRQVLGNLLTNAIIHTPQPAKITVRLRSDSGSAIVEVVDTGQGLPPEQAERVFERFYRADAARRRDREANSTGLGLAIVAALVRAHGGSVEVDSVPGKGSTFRVRLPLATGEDDHDDADGPGPDPASGGSNGAGPNGHSQTTLSPAPGPSQSGGER
ncbi:two-component sensor histidine kinase [Asanoa ishikariensis]|uniref:histidine kinase n=1 Tax=Asanoa ishikariensis TaxID=137265 RepID=A0A1H3R2U8_9ACTN|nr:HAMP domain-containing sensor histidine kinase [Asanoa ishikariensis]GIF64471.1 two-component sensor histidine kinase [Asanoa ishikariensis]SDZ19950.1 two-component system, OmpR family, sensor kinase [Asanoa ishikariensis]